MMNISLAVRGGPPIICCGIFFVVSTVWSAELKHICVKYNVINKARIRFSLYWKELYIKRISDTFYVGPHPPSHLSPGQTKIIVNLLPGETCPILNPIIRAGWSPIRRCNYVSPASMFLARLTTVDRLSSRNPLSGVFLVFCFCFY